MEKVILVLLISLYPLDYGLGGYMAHALYSVHSNHMGDTRRPLPVGQRVDGYLPLDKPVRYYFTVNKSQSAVTIRVTPCESPILWTLSILSTQDYSEHLIPKKKYHHIGPQRIFSIKGNGEESFSSIVTSDGYYFLDFMSLESDTSFQVFVLNQGDESVPWPILPEDPRVDVLSVEENKVDLSWEPSLGPSEIEVEYCLFINRRHNYKTLCATEQDAKSEQDNLDTKGKKSMNIITEKSKSKVYSYPKSYKSVKVLGMEGDDNFLSSKTWAGGQRMCVGTSLNATVYGLKPKSLYFFDVFAINSKDGLSVAYTGTFAETKPKQRSQIPKLAEEEIVNVFLKRKGVKIMSIDPSASGLRWLFVHSCLHKAHIQITVNGQIEVSKSLQGAYNFKLIGNPKDNFIISLKSSKGGPGLVKLFTTTARNHLPFSSLPPDINMSVSKRTCSSATVTWTGSGPGTKYCIYVRHLEHHLDLKLIHKHQNSCLNTNARSRAEKVVCRQAGSQTTLEENITDLKPGKSYLIDLYFISLHNNTIKFPSQVVKAQEWCT
ncbi:protein NDNF-like [Hyla sarda]|uniref:protein NDNF-like n=1 Tax=Hyla sarda TaxID=327740 RepID=UPI0024C41BBD|nr:protein NDNF-like [Hyla sarda]XP_056372883.1 protein NDNF-like [Hyla sarda]